MKLLETRLNTHMYHMEDLVLLGKEGLDELSYKIDQFVNEINNGSSELNITQKIDGSPAILMGHGLAGYPDVCVGIKSLLSDPKNALSSEKEIDAKYSGRPHMAMMLKYGLQLAKNVPVGEVWQGDCLFTKNTLRTRTINGVDYITFQPNKIIYAFEKSSESYEKILNSDFGIAIHTRYIQNGSSWYQSFRINPSTIDIPDNIYVLSPAIDYSRSSDDYDLGKLNSLNSKLISLKHKLLSMPEYEVLINNELFMKYWNTFENNSLADKKAINIDINMFYDDLIAYVNSKREKELSTRLSKLKTDKGKEKASITHNEITQELNDIILNNKDVLITLVETLNVAANIKMIILNGLNKSTSDFKSFLKRKSTGEYVDSDGEGISMSDLAGNVVKLVDRSSFSNANRDPDFESGFDHNLYEDINSPKTVAFTFGRFNPCTIGHLKLINKLASIDADENRLYLSHTQDKKKNPLTYEQKLRYCDLAFGNKVQVTPSDAKTIFNVLTELYNEGVQNVIIVGGSDRIGGSEDYTKTIMAYNGATDKKGNLVYQFDSIKFVSSGERSDDSEDITERASASLARKYAQEDDFDSFETIVPFDGEVVKSLFNDVRAGLGLSESSSLTEAFVNSNIERAVKQRIINAFSASDISNDVDIISTSKHPKEILRIRPHLGKSIDYKKEFEEILNDIQPSLQETYNGLQLQIGDLKAGVSSGMYESYPITISTEEETTEMYITIASKYKKLYTPNKVLDQSILGTPVYYKDLVNYIVEDSQISDVLKKIISGISVSSKVDTGKEAIKYLIHEKNEISNSDFTISANFDDMDINSELFSSIESTLRNDFGEIMGSVALSNVLSDKSKIIYPLASNEKLVDYTIRIDDSDPILVSAKAGAGAKPSSAEPIRAAYDQLASEDKNSNGVKFIEWIYNNITNASIHDGYINLANLLLDPPSWFDAINIPDVYKQEGSIKSYSDAEKLRSFCNSLGYGQIVSSITNLGDHEEYFETLRIRMLANISLAIINKSEELIDTFNSLLSRSFGTFIQIYLTSLTHTNVKFKCKIVSINGEPLTTNRHKYYFSGNSAINPKTFKLGVKKVSLVLK